MRINPQKRIKQNERKKLQDEDIRLNKKLKALDRCILQHNPLRLQILFQRDQMEFV